MNWEYYCYSFEKETIEFSDTLEWKSIGPIWDNIFSIENIIAIHLKRKQFNEFSEENNITLKSSSSLRISITVVEACLFNKWNYLLNFFPPNLHFLLLFQLYLVFKSNLICKSNCHLRSIIWSRVSSFASPLPPSSSSSLSPSDWL